MTETSDEEEYAWMDKYLQSIPALHEFMCEICGSTSLFMAWCGQHGMKSCPTYKTTQQAPRTCGMLLCMLSTSEMTL